MNDTAYLSHFGPTRATVSGLETPFGDGAITINRRSFPRLPQTKDGLLAYFKKAAATGRELVWVGNSHAKHIGDGVWHRLDGNYRVLEVYPAPEPEASPEPEYDADQAVLAL
jgi:hypothetical protein